MPGATSDAWARMPPLQRTLADTTSVAPPEAFRSSLASHQDPSFLSPLGHLIESDGPSGIIGGLASPTGQPVPYEGAVELRVPTRTATNPALVAQRQVAALRPVAAAPHESALGAASTPGEITAEAPREIPAAELVVARSIADATAPQADRPMPTGEPVPMGESIPTEVPTESGDQPDPSGATASLLAGQPPLSEHSALVGLDPATPTTATPTTANPTAPAPSGSAAPGPQPLTVPTARSTPPVSVVQRHLADGTPSGPAIPMVAGAGAPTTVASTLPLGSPGVASGTTGPPTAPPPPAATSTMSTGSAVAPAMSSPATTSSPVEAPDYPPLIARSVQRRRAGSAEPWSDPAPSAAVADPGQRTGPGEEAPLSGFAAAISTLQADATPLPRADAQGLPSPAGEPAGGVQPPGPALADEPVGAISPAGPVVARRVAPDGEGRLPAAETWLRPVSALLTSGLGPSIPGTPAPVQRSLLFDRPGLRSPSAMPIMSPPAVPVPPTVQRLRYPGPEDPTGDGRAGLDDPAVGSAVEPAAADAAPGAATWSWSSPDLPPAGSAGIAMPTAPAAAAWSPVSPPASTTVSRAVAFDPPGRASAQPPIQRAVVPGPSPIQRLADEPSPGGQPGSQAPAAGRPATAVSSRTVGLAELFALAAARDGEESVQRSGADDLRAAETPPADMTVQTATVSAPPPTAPAPAAGTPAPAAISGAELEEMARRLYEPLSSRLRAELWQDRERSGLLTDLRP